MMALGMFLLILGHVVLCYFAFGKAVKKFEESTRWLRAKFTVPVKKSFPHFFLQTIGSVPLFHSPQELKQDALELIDSGDWTKRQGLLLLGLAGLASIVWLAMFNLLFKLQGSFLLFSGALAYFSKKKFPHWGAFFWFIFYAGLFVLAVELAMRPGNIVMRSGAFQEVLFVLADNRWPAIIGALIFSAVLTLLMRLEGWAWVAALLGVVMGVMSLNVALVFVMGESFGWQILLWRETKKSGMKKVAREMAIVHFAGLALFLVLYALLRNELFLFKFGEDLNNLLARIGDFLFMVPTWLAFQTFILLIWGHFRAK